MSKPTLFAVALLAAVSTTDQLQAQCQVMSNGQCVGACRDGVCVMVGSSCTCPQVRAREPAEVTPSDQLATLIRPNANRQKACRKQNATLIEHGCK
jgi:hypothetical protein